MAHGVKQRSELLWTSLVWKLGGSVGSHLLSQKALNKLEPIIHSMKWPHDQIIFRSYLKVHCIRSLWTNRFTVPGPKGARGGHP